MPDNLTVRDIMTAQPKTFPASAPIDDAARAMRDSKMGAVLITLSGKLEGILTDRDITVRAVAEDMDPKTTPVGEICSREVNALAPGDDLNSAATVMRDKAIRRLPVIENGKAIGIVSLGDLAEKMDPSSVLGQISSAPANQ